MELCAFLKIWNHRDSHDWRIYFQLYLKLFHFEFNFLLAEEEVPQHKDKPILQFLLGTPKHRVQTRTMYTTKINEQEHSAKIMRRYETEIHWNKTKDKL